jgi:hypothetical protein
VLAGIVLSSQSSFNKSLVLANAAYDMALTIRSAETYGLGSKAVGTAASVGYGIHISAAAPDSFILFADAYPSPSAGSCHGLPSGGASAPDAKPGNCVFDPSQSETISTYTLGNGITIRDFCAKVGGSWTCSDSGVATAAPRPGLLYSLAAALTPVAHAQGAGGVACSYLFYVPIGPSGCDTSLGSCFIGTPPDCPGYIPGSGGGGGGGGSGGGDDGGSGGGGGESPASPSSIASLDVVFTRPNADTFMSVDGSYNAAFPVSAACIELTSGAGGSRFISISSAGQIAANASSCP